MATDLTGLDDAVANVTGQKQQVAAAGVRNSMQFAPAANPDAEAEHRHLAQYLSQPLDTVRADPEQARVQASLLATDADRLAADAPQTADLLNDPSNARMLHDQIPNVAATEQAVGTLAAQPHQNPWSDAANYVFGSGIASSDKANWNKPSLVGDVARAVVSGFASMAKGVNIVGGAIPTAADAWSSLISGQKTTDMSDAYFKSMVDPLVARMGENALPTDAGFVRRVVDASGKLVPTLAAIAVTGGAAEAPAASESITNVVANAVSHAIKSMAVPSTTSAVTTASDVLNAGGSGLDAGTAGATQFGVSSAQGVMPLSAPGGLLTRALGGGASFAVTSELGRQAMNAVTPDSMQQPFDPEEVLVNAIMGGALGGIHGPRPAPDMAAAIRQTYTDAANAAQAGQTMDTLQKLGELATTGKFRERDPQAFNQFVNDVVDQTGAPDLYVDGRKLAEALDQGNVSAAELSAKLPDVADQMREALQSEGTVKISLADYATHIAGGPLDASLLPHLKTEPGGMTYDEAQQFHQEQVDQLTPEAQALAAADTEKTDARATELQGVHDTVLDQLNATGRYPTDVSKAYAALTRDFYGTMAERTGQTPGELFAAHPLHVAAEDIAGERLEQTRPEAVSAVDTGKRSPITGKPLIHVLDADGNTIETSHAAATTDEALQNYRERPARQAAAEKAPAPAYTVPAQEVPERSNWKQTKGQKFTALDADDDYLYHVAPSDRADGIREKGLAPNAGGTFGGFYRDYSAGKVFLTERSGVSFWKERVENQLQHASENPPAVVVMRIPKDKITAELKPDDVGSQDARAQAYYSENTLKQDTNARGTYSPSTNTITALNIAAESVAGEHLSQATETPEFKNWFGDSKVVDTEGKPLVVYHGRSGDFEQFDVKGRGKTTGTGAFFTSSPDVAATYTGGTGNAANIVPAHLSLKNPLVVEGKGQNWNVLGKSTKLDMPAVERADKDEALLAELENREPNPTATVKAKAQKTTLGKLFPKEFNYSDGFSTDDVAAWARAQGFDGVIFRNVKDRGPTGEFHTDADSKPADLYVAFDPSQVKSAVGNRGTFDPNDPSILNQETGARGTYSPETNTITALQGADLSTYLHELGHHFLETTARLAAEPGAPEGIKADVAHLLGADSPADWLAKPLAERRDVHENFARGFEAYLMEGKAPTPELQSLFGRFRSWLLQVYKSLSALHVQLSPEVRGVMDRMLATDAEIKQAEAVRSMEAMFKAKPEGISNEAYEAYQGLDHQATEDAVANLQSRSLRDMQWLSNAKSKAMKGLQKQADTERAAIRDEVTAEVDQLPAFAAKEQLDRETDPNRAFKDQQAEWRAARDAQPKAKRADWIKDNPEPTKPRTQVDDWNDLRTAAEEQVRATVKKAAAGDAKGLAKGQALMKAKRSIDNEVERSMIEWEQANPKPKIDKPKADLELVAEQHGFNTADEMLHAIDAAGKKADVIEALTDQRMLERHGDLVDPRSIERAAEAAVHNDARTRFLATELTALAKATGSPRLLALAAKEAADAAIAAKRVRDLRPDQYSASEGRAGRAADKAFKAGDIQTAAVQKRAQLLSNTLARSATEAAGEIAKAVDYLKKFDKASIREKIDVDYRDQIDSLLAAHDLRTSVSGKALDKRVSLKDFVEREQAAGREPMVPQDLIDEANQVHYKDMTVESFRGMVDAVRSLDHLGRLKTKILDGRDARDFKAVVDEAVASMGALPQRDPETNRGLSAVDKKWLGVKSTIRSADASLLKMEQVIDWLDGHNANGVMNRVVFRRIADAGTRENDLRTDIVGKLHELAASQPKGYGKDFDEKLSLPGLIDTKTGKTQILLKRELLSAALNRGNESNWQKLLKGEKGWNEAALLRAFDEHLTKADWDYVQGVWHSINSLWPEIDAMERRLGNTSPEKIAPRAFDTPHGTYEGGYYPAVYDPLRSFDVEQNRQRSSEALFENNYQKATTSKGHTIERSENYARPFLLSLDVIPRHMTQVIHDIAYREAVMDADRFLADPRVREGVEGALGREYYQQFRPWLQALANDKVYDSRGLAFWDQAAHWARTSTTMVGLGYRLSTMMIHGATAASNSVGEIGARWMASGVRDVLGTPAKMSAARDFIFERSGEMRHRMGEVDRDIRDQLREMEAKAATGLTGRTAEVINGVKRAAFYGVAMLDFASAMPTWMGAYNRGLHEGLAEQEAVYAADKAVRNAHGGTGTKDLAAIQRGPEFQKLFTMFYSFWNHFYNRQRDLGRAATQIPGKIAEGDYAGARRDFAMVLARSFFYFIAPQLLHAALKPPAPGTQDEEENWAHWAAKEIALSMFSGVPVVRDVANSISTGRDYNPTPAVSIVKSVAATAKDVHGVATGQGPSDKWVQHAVQTAGYVFGLPTGQASSSAQFLWDVADGKQDPQGLADWWKGLKNGHL